MSEEQKKQIEQITAEVKKLTPEVREGALLYLQGLANGAAAMARAMEKQEVKT